MLELYLSYINSNTNCQYPNIPATQQINYKNVKKHVDIAKSLGYNELTLKRNLELHKMTIELLTAEEIELLDTLEINDLPEDDGDCLIFDAED